MKKIEAKSVKDFKLRFFTNEYESAFFQKEVNAAELVIPRIGEAVWLPPDGSDFNNPWNPNDPWDDGHKFRVLDVEYPYYNDTRKPMFIDIMVRDVNREEVDN